MGGGCHGGVANLEADGGHGGHTLHELGLQILRRDVEDLGVEHGAGVVHLEKRTKIPPLTHNVFKKLQ